jgi:hypothetical protein
MSRHLKYVLLTRLSNHVEDTKQFCADPSVPVQDIVIDDVPYDGQDKATQRFYELMDSSEDNQKVAFGRLRVNLIDALQIHTKHRTTDSSLALQEFLVTGDEGGSWAQLNRLFRHMTGSTLSEISNPENILIHAEELGLDGNQWFSANLEIANLGKTKFVMTNTVAIASTLDHLLFLIRDDVLRRSDSYNWLRNKKFISSVDGVSSPEDMEPLFITVNKNGRYFMQLFIVCAEAEGEFEVDWERVRYSPSRETIKAISAVAPPEVGNRIKGRHLEDGLGL